MFRSPRRVARPLDSCAVPGLRKAGTEPCFSGQYVDCTPMALPLRGLRCRVVSPPMPSSTRVGLASFTSLPWQRCRAFTAIGRWDERTKSSAERADAPRTVFDDGRDRLVTVLHQLVLTDHRSRAAMTWLRSKSEMVQPERRCPAGRRRWSLLSVISCSDAPSPPVPEAGARGLRDGLLLGAERKFWLADGVHSTAVGYSGGTRRTLPTRRSAREDRPRRGGPCGVRRCEDLLRQAALDLLGEPRPTQACVKKRRRYPVPLRDLHDDPAQQLVAERRAPSTSWALDTAGYGR